MQDFNINWKNLHYLIPVFIFIIGLSFGRIAFGISGGIAYFGLYAALQQFLFRGKSFQVSKEESGKVNKKKEKVYLWIFMPLIIAVIILIPALGPYFQDHIMPSILHALNINPDTALDSIRSFLGIKIRS